MRILLSIFIVLLFTSFKLPGSGTAYLTCKSESGRTLFNAELQDIIGMLDKAELKIDGETLAFDSDDEVRTIFDPKMGVFTIYMTGSPNKRFPNGRFLTFWVIPESFKIISAERANQKYSFKAKLEATEPRDGSNRGLATPQVVLSGVLVYKI